MYSSLDLVLSLLLARDPNTHTLSPFFSSPHNKNDDWLGYKLTIVHALRAIPTQDNTSSFYILPFHIDTTRNYIPNGWFLQNKLLSNYTSYLFSPSNPLFLSLDFCVNMVSCIRHSFFIFFLLSSSSQLNFFPYIAT